MPYEGDEVEDPDPQADRDEEGQGPADPAAGASPHKSESKVSILDEEAQRTYDLAAIDAAIDSVRKMLANAKVNLTLAQEGLLDQGQDLHPQKFRSAIVRHRKTLGVLVELGVRAKVGLPDDPTTRIEVAPSERAAPEGS